MVLTSKAAKQSSRPCHSATWRPLSSVCDGLAEPQHCMRLLRGPCSAIRMLNPQRRTGSGLEGRIGRQYDFLSVFAFLFVFVYLQTA